MLTEPEETETHAHEQKVSKCVRLCEPSVKASMHWCLCEHVSMCAHVNMVILMHKSVGAYIWFCVRV